MCHSRVSRPPKADLTDSSNQQTSLSFFTPDFRPTTHFHHRQASSKTKTLRNAHQHHEIEQLVVPATGPPVPCTARSFQPPGGQEFPSQFRLEPEPHVRHSTPPAAPRHATPCAEGAVNVKTDARPRATTGVWPAGAQPHDARTLARTHNAAQARAGGRGPACARPRCHALAPVATCKHSRPVCLPHACGFRAVSSVTLSGGCVDLCTSCV